MSMASDLVVLVRVQIAKFATEREALAAVHNQIAEAMIAVQAATDGSSDLGPAEAVVRFQVGLDALEEAQKELKAVEDALEEYAADVMGGSGGSLPARSSAEPPAVVIRRGAPSAEQSSEKTTGMRRNLQREEVIKRIGWPTKPGRPDDIRARGVLYGAGEKPVWGSEDDPLWANRFGLASQRTDLKPGWAKGSEKTSTWHIEGNVAAWMVKHQRKDMVLYINQSVCGMRENVKPDPERCGENVKHVLPKGYTLYVHSVLESGTVRITRHRGTGKAIKDEE